MANQTMITRARRREPRPVGLQGQAAYAEGLYQLLGLVQPTMSLPVTDAHVRGLPAAWAAVAKISNAVGQMMAMADVVAGDGRTPMATPPVVDQPDVALGSFTFWKMVAGTAIMRGNFIGIKADISPAGYPNQVVSVPSDAVHAYYDQDGYVVYEIAGEPYAPDELVHVRCGVTLPGQVMTIGFVEAHRRGLAGMLDQQGMANSVFKEGATPSGVVQLDVDNPTVEQATVVKSNWVGNLGGRRAVAVVGRKQTYTPVTWSADDAQFIETQQMTVAMIALMVGLHPNDLDATIGGSGSTYSNRQDDALQRIVDAYTPVMLPIEQEWSRLIPGKAFVRGNPEALLRSTTAQRYALRKVAQEIGIETPDESRAEEGKPALPKDTTPPPPATDPTTDPTADPTQENQP